jgi:hypothetical protein
MSLTRGILICVALALLGGCATMPTGPTVAAMPTGPTVAAMPGPGKPFEVFQADDYACTQWAQGQIGGASPSQTANQNLATGAVVGTAAGAGLGALIGSASGHAGAGAAIGAGAGLLTGTAVGSNSAASSQYSLQRRYDMAYQQCMYAKGKPGPRRQAGAGVSATASRLRAAATSLWATATSLWAIPGRAPTVEGAGRRAARSNHTGKMTSPSNGGSPYLVWSRERLHRTTASGYHLFTSRDEGGRLSRSPTIIHFYG